MKAQSQKKKMPKMTRVKTKEKKLLKESQWLSSRRS